jgi:hypothetical protein
VIVAILIELTCAACDLIKPSSDFYKGRDGYLRICKQCSAKRWRKYFSKNKARLKKEWREYYDANREKRRADAAKRANTPAARLKQRERDRKRRSTSIGRANQKRRNAEYRLRHLERLREYDRVRGRNFTAEEKTKRHQFLLRWKRERRKRDPAFRLREILSRQISQALAERGYPKRQLTFQIVDYSAAELVAHIEQQFVPGMTWGNYGKGAGKWTLDHKRPNASFHERDYRNIEAMLRASFALSNLQPMWHPANSQKASAWDGDHWALGKRHRPARIGIQQEQENLGA